MFLRAVGMLGVVAVSTMGVIVLLTGLVIIASIAFPGILSGVTFE
ncbi:MAG: hypothetical protein ACRCSP_04310 [Rhodoglobus sp.]